MLAGANRTPTLLRRAVLFALGACSAQPTGIATGGIAFDASARLEPCDPLLPEPTTLTTVFAVGKDRRETIYVADGLPMLGPRRVFVGTGDTLRRKHVADNDSDYGAAGTDVRITFQDPFDDGSTARDLLLHILGGVTTTLQLGPSGARRFGDSVPGNEDLALLDAAAIAGMKVENTPFVVRNVVEIEGSNVVLMTSPMDDLVITRQNDGAADNVRLYYGSPSDMVERRVVTIGQNLSGDTGVDFLIGETKARLRFQYRSLGDAGVGVGTLVIGDAGALPATHVLPTPKSVAGYSFTCFVP